MKISSTALLLLFLLVQSGFSSDSENRKLIRQFINSTKSFDVLSKDANADAFAKDTIAGHSKGSPYADGQFVDYMLKKAPERIRILYAIQLLTGEITASSSGIAEVYTGYALALLENRISEINKAEQAEKK